ncbi:unnamed protein product [Adineta steineri]|uniref:NmrA-like domain-containing protein n=3 Tax=Adineta steineri TaxID=433720 RepID=A0A815I3G7_9BILA|nr:unnamed protein product [Adineta steineri]CAF3567504.1 unnamed protein product [Adineta steineri]
MTEIIKPILVTGAGGGVGSVSGIIISLLRKKNLPVRALVRRDDERVKPLRELGAEIVIGDLTQLPDVHRAINGCSRVYFSIAVGSGYLEASLNTMAVAKHYGVEVFVNMSQMTVSKMNITKTSASPQVNAHWLGEQALEWSGIPFVNIRPTIFMENPHLYHWAKTAIAKHNELRIPFGSGRIPAIAAYDVARVAAAILADPTSHIGKSYELTGPKTVDMNEVAKSFSNALGREIHYISLDWDEWKATTLKEYISNSGWDQHSADHLANLAKIIHNGTVEATSNVELLTGSPGMNHEQWMKHHAEEFTAKE